MDRVWVTVSQVCAQCHVFPPSAVTSPRGTGLEAVGTSGRADLSPELPNPETLVFARERSL